MNHRYYILKCALMAAVFLAVACILSQPKKKDGLAMVHVLDVGQGDSILIESASGSQVLIDGGKDAKVLSALSSVMPASDRFIDVVIATHPDLDHIGGLPGVLSRYKVGLFMTPEVFSDSDRMEAVYWALSRRGIPAVYTRRGMTLYLDKNPDTKITILFPDRSTIGWQSNAASAVARLDVGSASALFTADAPSAIERFLVLIDQDGLDTDVVKLGHHGSKTSSSDLFLKTASPALALISAGKNNSYGHPHQEVLGRLQALHIPWRSTALEGTITLKSDGKTWVMR